MKVRGKKTSGKVKRRTSPLRLDPSRTGLLRRAFSAALRKRFRRLRLELVQLIDRDDALGLRRPVGFAANAFCPTGDGGGIDPSCSPGGAGGTGGTPAGTYQPGSGSGTLYRQRPGSGEPPAAVKEDARAVRQETIHRRYKGKEIYGTERMPGSDAPEIDEVARLTYDVLRHDMPATRDLAVTWSEETLTATLWSRTQEIGSIGYSRAGDVRVKLVNDVTVRSQDDVRTMARKIHRAASIRPPAALRLPPTANSQAWDEQWPVENVFCATGEGGGVDPSCSSGGAAMGGGFGPGAAAASMAHDAVEKAKQAYDTVTAAPVLKQARQASEYLAGKTADLYRGLENRYGRPQAVAIMASAQVLGWGALGVGAAIGVPLYLPGVSLWGSLPAAALAETYLQASRGVAKLTGNAEPQPLTPEEVEAEARRLLEQLRDDYMEYLREHADEIKRAGGWDEPATNLTTNDRWRFHSAPDKIRAFQAWLKQEAERRLLGIPEHKLWDHYIEEGFRKGAGRAFDDTTRSERSRAAIAESMEHYAGTRDQFLRSAFGQPVAVEKVQLLAGRTFDELEGVTQDMSVRMTRHLVDGLTTGKSPREIAREMAADVDVSEARALTIARTEIIRAHASGQLHALEELGVEEVGVAVEFSTAGDDRVCFRCSALEGVVLKLDEAQGIIPVHNNCRCAWLPAGILESEKGQKRSKTAIDAAASEADLDIEISTTRPRSVLGNAAGMSAEMVAFSRWVSANAFCPTGEGGGVDPSCGKGEGGAGSGKKTGGAAQYTPSVTLKPSRQRAFEGKQVAVKNPLGKQAAGKLGEEIIIAHLQEQGLRDARPMNLDRNNFPIDLIQDSEVIEGKTGQAGNSAGAQQFRLTIGEPGKAEKAWLAAASPADKAAWNAKKQEKIHERKEGVIKGLSAKFGRPIKVATMAVIINPDTKTADIFKWSGFHDRIGWNSEQAKSGYIRSVKYA